MTATPTQDGRQKRWFQAIHTARKVLTKGSATNQRITYNSTPPTHSDAHRRTLSHTVS